MITLRDLLIILLVLALIGFFVPAWRPYRGYIGPAGAVLVILLILVLARIL